ncbi:WD repeat-containing protein 97-like isoform X2 [Montipora capricornis]|uniref:WD repeat-containing protein 97-like isoform X2 n=1 Tax=Montipora capricornis TaxID=246305 RepID=UPI0035F1768E
MTSKLMQLIAERTQRPVLDESDLKVSSHWKLIKSTIKQEDGDNPRKLDKKQPLVVGHGIHPVQSLPCEEEISFVAFNSCNNNFVGIDSEKKASVFFTTGHKEPVDKNILKGPVCGIVYAKKPRFYVAWGLDENIRLMSEGLNIVSVARSVSRIYSGVYNESTNEIITGGIGSITCWSFRYGAKFLLQRKVLSECLPETSVISLLCLEDTPSRSQRCFAVYHNNIIVYNLLNGSCVGHMKELHPREITAILFFNPLKYLVTSAKDGSIKVWDDKYNIKIIFVGHLKSVNALAVYPFGTYIISGSTDCTIRVWSLDTADEVDRISTSEAVLGLGTIIGKNELYSFGSHSIELWKIEHIHSVFATVGSKVKSIKSTTHPRMPMRLLCTCSDATVRLLSPGSGECITTMLLPSMSVVTDVAYAAAENLLFTLLSDGKILKASTMTNPCKILQEWDLKRNSNVPSACSCLCLYEYVAQDEFEGDSWGNVVAALKSKKKAEELQNSAGQTNSYDRTLLLGGCVDGMIVVFEWQSESAPGSVSFKIEAHRDEVITVTANPFVDQVISAGMDHTIKIWRLFPFAEEALAPLMTLYCHETPKLLSVAHHKLCAAFHEPATASYNIVVFKTTQKKRFDHESDLDHVDDVTGLASCPKMRLFASCSADGSVKIWDESNRLLRIIKLNASPTSVCFSSQKGDLIVGIGKNLHKINYASYMPQSYIYRMVAMDFRRVVSEAPIDIDSDVKDELSPEEYQRLSRVKSSLFKFREFKDKLPQDEMEEIIQEEARRSQAFAKIQERENELRKLRDGTYEFNRKRPNIDLETVRGEAFERYLEIFYKRPCIDLPENNFGDEEYPREKEEPYSSDLGTGFFSISRNSTKSKKGTATSLDKVAPKPILNLSMPEFEPITLEDDDDDKGVADLIPAKEQDQLSQYRRPFTMETENEIYSHEETSSRVSHSAPIHKGQFRSYPIEPPLVNRNRDRYVVDVPKSSQYPSPSYSTQLVSQRLSRMAAHQTAHEEDDEVFVIAPDGFVPNSVVVAIFKDSIEETKEEKRDTWKPPRLTEEQIAELESRKKKVVYSPDRESPREKTVKKKSKFADQLELALRDFPTPKDAELLKSPTPTPPPSPPPVRETSPAKTVTPPKKVKPIRPIEKLVTRPKDPSPEPLPSPPREATPPPPPPPPTPLPSFISQFKGLPWFDNFFSDANSELLPKPWTADGFVEVLLSLIQKTPDLEIKMQMCAAIMLLNRQEGLTHETGEKVNRTMIAELNIPNHPTAHGLPEAKQFLRVALQLSHSMRIYEVSFVAELMAQFIDGDEEIRKFVQELFSSMGVSDTGGYFAKELDMFDSKDVPENRRKGRVKDMCVEWLNKWLAEFRQHIRTLAGKISRAQAGSVVKGTKTPKTPGSIKGILKTDKGSSQQQHKATSEMSKPTSITFDLEALGGKAADKASPAEAINYFCDIKMEEELERVRTRPRVKSPVQAKDNSRNTVLVLPKIQSKRSLARLGETHCSHCHPERETSLALAFPLPTIYQTRRRVVFNNIVLHLNTLTLNPFPDDDDAAVYEPAQQSQLLTLRSSQKYFFPGLSYVEPVTETVSLSHQIRKVLL